MFSVIASSGHCGTKWLAAVLDSQPGSTWYHHFRHEMTNAPWELLDLRHPTDPFFEPYWRWIRGELVHNDVGDANSWPPHLILKVNEHQPIDRIIYLTRNGIQQLNSLLTTSPAFMRDPMPEAAQVKLRSLGEIGGYGEIINWPQFAQLCLLVAANYFMPDWLRGRGLNVLVYSLEELTTDVNKLKELAPGLTKKQLKEWQKQDINRKVMGDRDPATLWGKMTDDQKATYSEIVGDPEI